MAEILFPPARMIGGNLDKTFPRTGDNGQPKLGKDGQPEQQCNIGIAIPKQGEAHWNQTAWGKVIYDTGAAAHPNFIASPLFSWKVTDGDSQIPNKRGKRPCDQTGYPGHWVLWFSQGWLPKRVNADGTCELPEGSIVPGYYVRMYGSVAGNKLVQNGTPGVYLNPIAVALVGEGDKIATDVDTAGVFAGGAGAPLPAGARPVQAAAPQFQAPVAPPVTAPPVVPQAPAVPPAPVYPAGGVQPAPNYIAPPPVAPPVAPVAPPVPAGPTMTPAALQAGYTYDFLRGNGWSDDQMRAQGYLV